MAIVKVQRPLSHAGRALMERECLVYAQHKTMMRQQSVPSEAWAVVEKRALGKAFFEAEWDDDKMLWIIGRQVGDRAW